MLKVYNTLTRSLEEFKPLHPPQVNMYVCGVTVYDYCHLGHARAYVVWDMVRNYLEYSGYKVNYVQNFTDIDDKIIQRAREKKVEPLALAHSFIDEYFQDLDGLGVRRADLYPRATEHIPEMENVIRGLMAKGLAYQNNGDVFYRVKNFDKYGSLSRIPLDDLQAGARVELDERKESPLDFALWKSSKPGEPVWESPWGKGRPGWHIECTAMVLKHLGETINIHAGGSDLIFPHHENEIAQSEGYTGKPFVKYWLHNGFVTFLDEKMSKSLGNFKTIRELLKSYSPETIRYFLLSTHYRNPLDFSDEALLAAEKGLKKLARALKTVTEDGEKYPSKSLSPAFETFIRDLQSQFIMAMDDDFGSPQAWGIIFKSLDEGRKLLGKEKNKEANLRFHSELDRFLKLFGIDIQKVAQALPVPQKVVFEGVLPFRTTEDGIDQLRHISSLASQEELIQKLVLLRLARKVDKNWAEADNIRNHLNQRGVILEDISSNETLWYLE